MPSKIEGGMGNHLEPAKYRIRCRCLRCNNEYSYTVTRISDKDRPCPKKSCREAARQEEIERMAANMARMIEEGRAPSQIGNNNAVKAHDLAATIAMEDHKMTNLEDAKREGDTSAPKLAPVLQAQADNFFGGGKALRRSNPALANQMNLIGQRAIKGSFRPQGGTIMDTIGSPDLGPKLKPPIRVIAGDRG